MSDNKSGISSNFENLKKEMLKKKKATADNAVNNLVTKNVSEIVNKNVNSTEHKNVNKIVIKVKDDDDTPIRTTTYLKPSTILKVSELAEKANIYNYEVVQTALDYFFENVELEK